MQPCVCARKNIFGLNLYNVLFARHREIHLNRVSARDMKTPRMQNKMDRWEKIFVCVGFHIEKKNKKKK